MGCCVCGALLEVREPLGEEMAKLQDKSKCPDTIDRNRRNPDVPTWSPPPPHREPVRIQGHSPDQSQAGIYISCLTGFPRKPVGYSCPSSCRRSCNTPCRKTNTTAEAQKDRVGIRLSMSTLLLQAAGNQICPWLQVKSRHFWVSCACWQLLHKSGSCLFCIVVSDISTGRP